MDTIEYLSPCGILHLAAAGGKLIMCDWADSSRHRGNLERLADRKMDYDLISCAKRQLDEYFSGRRHRFDIAVSPAGTPFRRKVWECLAEIPFGETLTYGELAGIVGMPDGARAVAGAVAANPVSIFIPCHRIIGAGGGLTGYAGGMAAKRFLLELEK
ncbi:MAG: methylated-DNA--[protein]-cysteine S-methyltransferase [Muribaculaceae bacterium]|nr:methylated-DNA--[protein]-cysteine S-methyltransferase [Muribaculaceae bacterium]